VNIIGDKIYLRAIELSDKDFLLEMVNDDETEHSLGGWSFPVSNIDQEEWIKALKLEKNILRCMIIKKNDNKLMGTIGLSNIDYKNGNAEIHIKLSKSNRGKGYGFDAIKSVTKYGFEELRLNCIYAHINSYNTPSQKIFEKCGFCKEGELRSRIFKKGQYHDIFSYSIIREE